MTVHQLSIDFLHLVQPTGLSQPLGRVGEWNSTVVFDTTRLALIVGSLFAAILAQLMRDEG